MDRSLFSGSGWNYCEVCGEIPQLRISVRIQAIQGYFLFFTLLTEISAVWN